MSKYNSFYYNFPTLLLFGDKSLNNLFNMRLIEKYEKVLIITAGDFIHQFGIIECLKDKYKSIDFIVEDTNLFNTSVADISELKNKYKDANIDLIIAIGGGSVIDACKLLSLTLNDERDVASMLESNSYAESIIPLGTFCTVPASGSEANSSFVIIDNRGKKLARANNNVRPIFSVLNSEYVKTLPTNILRASLSDIMSHLLEQYLSNHTATTFIDDLIIASIINIIRNKEGAIKGDLNALEDIMLCATFSLSYCLSMGKIMDWNVHEIEHGFSGLYKTSHGEMLSVIFPRYLKYSKVQDFYSERLNYLNSSLINYGGINAVYDYFEYLSSDENILNFTNIEEVVEIVLNGRSKIGRNVLLGADDIKKILSN